MLEQRIAILAILSLSLIPASLYAQDYYVDGKTGANVPTNGTSRTSPWKTIGYALDRIPRPGPGTNPRLWVEGDQVYSQATNGETFPIRAAYRVWVEGTLPRGNRPVLAPRIGSTAVVFDPNEFYQRNEDTWRYLRFQGGAYGMRIGANPSQKHAPRIQDCEFSGQFVAGIRIDGLSTGTNDPRFFQNLFEDLPTGIAMHAPGTNTVVYPDIEENTFRRVGQDAVFLEDASPSGGNLGARIASNWFRWCRNGVRAQITNGGNATSLLVTSCSFAGMSGSGVFLELIAARGAALTITRSSFEGCAIGVAADAGAGTCALRLEDCSFTRSWIAGARVRMTGSNLVTFTSARNFWESNSIGCSIQGSATEDVTASLTGDLFIRNGFGVQSGSSSATSSIAFHSCIFAENRTLALALLAGASYELRSSTIANNTNGLILGPSVALKATHCVFTDNQAGITGPGISYEYCCFQNQTIPGTGNLSQTDPQLVRPFYKLAPTSPCIDAGDPTASLPTTDYEGDPRASVSKLGGAARPDLGADEYVFRGSARPYGTPGFGAFNFFPKLDAASPNASLGGTLEAKISGAWLPIYQIPASFALLAFGTRDDHGALPFDLEGVGAPGCLLWNDVVSTVGPLAVAPNGNASTPFPIPNQGALRGLTLTLQAYAFLPQANLAGFATTNGLRVTLGESTTQLVEEFDTDAFLDRDASAAHWGQGSLRPTQIGGSGIDGDFSLNTPGLEDLGGGRWLFRTTPEVVGGQTKVVEIPADRSFKNQPRQIRDGRLEFSSFVVPAGQTIVFRGTLPPRITVRGRAEVRGTLALDGSGQATSWDGSSPTGEPGLAGGCFGGKGGKGGDRGSGTGHLGAYDGEPGEDVRLLLGHAYAARAVGTGGRGSVQYPLDGLLASITTQGISGSVSDQLSAAGGGGGYDVSGELGKAYYTLGNKLSNLGPDAPGGLRFDAFPLPPSTLTADHFLVGGSGGGGAGSCPYFCSSAAKRYFSGGAGAGGGGAIAVRAGGSLGLATGARISASGGSGFQSIGNFNARPQGGGGSGGSIVLQCSGTVTQSGVLAVRGGRGSLVETTQAGFQMKVKGGDGAPGLVRLETLTPSVVQLGTCEPPASARDVAPLTERDVKVGTRSRWYRTDAGAPIYLRYRIDANVNAAPVSYSDDPSSGLPLAQEGEAVEFYVQGANLDAQGNPLPGQISEWLRYVGKFPSNQGRSLQETGYTSYRWQIVFDRSGSRDAEVERVAITWQL